jgi:hypothetical protein
VRGAPQFQFSHFQYPPHAERPPLLLDHLQRLPPPSLGLALYPMAHGNLLRPRSRESRRAEILRPDVARARPHGALPRLGRHPPPRPALIIRNPSLATREDVVATPPPFLVVLLPRSEIRRAQFSLEDSPLAAIRIGISGSASFQSARKSVYAARALAVSPCITYARARPRCASGPSGHATIKLR